jgi:hypothetical protein
MFSRTYPLFDRHAFEVTDLIAGREVLPSEGDSAAGVLAGTTLSPSLLLDLHRFTEDPATAHLLAVVAASVRHDKPLSIDLESGDRPLRLTLHPRRQLYYCELDLCSLSDEALRAIKVKCVQNDGNVASALASGMYIGSLRPLLWHLAMRGDHGDILPELAGNVRCRVTLGVSLTGLPLDGAHRRLVQQMKSAPVSVDDLLQVTQLGRSAVWRLWNALYLQSALMISRGI